MPNNKKKSIKKECKKKIRKFTCCDKEVKVYVMKNMTILLTGYNNWSVTPCSLTQGVAGMDGPCHGSGSQPLTAEARIRCWVNPFGICGQSGTGAGFSRVLRFSPVNIIPPSLSISYHLRDERSYVW
jgi:hypothetical protein